MKFELKLNKEQLVEIGKGAGKIGKAIVIEGTKAVALKSAAAVITQGFDEGFGNVKNLSMDDMLAGGKKKNEAKKNKKSLFSFKKKDETEELTDEEIVVLEEAVKESVETAVDNVDYKKTDEK